MLVLPDPEFVSERLAGYSITTGELLSENYISLVLTSDARLAADPEDRHSYRALLSNGRVSINENQFPIRTQTALISNSEILSVSAQGGVRVSSPPPRGGANEAKVGDFSGRKVFGRTILNEVRCIGTQAYVVGTRRSAYRRLASDQWDCIDADCYVSDDFKRSFMSIDGFDESEIYAVGDLGEIWLYNGEHWRQLDSPTNCGLNCVLCASNGTVYCGGAKGTILAGRGDQWRLVEDIPAGLEFWSLAFLDGRLLLTANTRSTHLLAQNGGFRPVDFGDCSVPLTAYHLKNRPSGLWLFGSKDIRCYADGVWREVATIS